jgi:hypothetical protein
MARIGQCVPDDPGRWGLCLILAGKFFHDQEDKHSRTLYAYTADHCWSPAHTHHGTRHVSKCYLTVLDVLLNPAGCPGSKGRMKVRS